MCFFRELFNLAELLVRRSVEELPLAVTMTLVLNIVENFSKIAYNPNTMRSTDI